MRKRTAWAICDGVETGRVGSGNGGNVSAVLTVGGEGGVGLVRWVSEIRVGFMGMVYCRA